VSFRRTCLASALVVALCHAAWAQPAVRYLVKLTDPERHLVQVTLEIPPGLRAHDLQLPVWNALYQVRDFSQYMNWIRASDASGQALPLTELNASRWKISGTIKGARVEYGIFLNDDGPFGAEFNSHHAFLNFAELLLYVDDARQGPQQVEFSNLPVNWKIATPLDRRENSYFAHNYDELADSPVEIGTFTEAEFTGICGKYRVVLDSPHPAATMSKIIPHIRRIVDEATRWMNDCPFTTYIFIYHFSDVPAGGGMEHAYSAAISEPLKHLDGNMDFFNGITAHEFFHLWDVKRIRPQSLEPIDYTRENYTPALWFSEGVDSTAAACIQLRAGLLDEPRFLSGLGEEITDLQDHPARLTQSVEQSSLDAWLEKYPYYGLPARSVSYYTKGELLGVLLDLQMRKASHDRASLQTLFRYMNEHYAKMHKLFADSSALRAAAENVSGADLRDFFAGYVSGTREIPWDDFFSYIGLRVTSAEQTVEDRGFEVVQKFDRPPIVVQVEPASAAEKAGLIAGDIIVQVNGKAVAREIDKDIGAIGPGGQLRLSITREGAPRELHWTLGTRKHTVYRLEDVPSITAEQRHRREMWLFDGVAPAQ
jgi:predicted metalloprotease with PDZ domain